MKEVKNLLGETRSADVGTFALWAHDLLWMIIYQNITTIRKLIKLLKN
jgi:hypothetical protein